VTVRKKQPDSPITTFLSKWLSGDVKRLAAQLIAIVVTLWTLFGVQGSVNSLASDVTNLKREVHVLEKFKKELRKVSEAQDDILEVIERATRVGPGTKR
jgi:hypothetical protein